MAVMVFLEATPWPCTKSFPAQLVHTPCRKDPQFVEVCFVYGIGHTSQELFFLGLAAIRLQAISRVAKDMPSRHFLPSPTIGPPRSAALETPDRSQRL